MRKSNVNKGQLLINWLCILGAAVTPSIMIYEHTYDFAAMLVFGVLLGVPSVLAVGFFLPNPDVDRQRVQEIHKAKLELSATKDTLRTEMAKLIELEDKYSGGQVDLYDEVVNQKKKVDFWQKCLETHQSKLNPLEEEDKKWREKEKAWRDLMQRADERLSQTNSTYARQSEHKYEIITEK